MAKDNEEIKLAPLKKIANLIQSNSDNIYKTTYYSDPTNKKQLDSLKNDINNSIKNIINNNNDYVGEPNISKLYERILMKQNDPSTVDEFEKIFGDNDFINNITNSYLDNRWIKVFNDEIDEVLRYMPKLEEALQVLRDNVLSADSFNKDFLNIECTTNTNTSTEQFNRNIAELKEIYNLLEFTNDTYYNASKYGEEFIYCVPYTKAIQNLMKSKNSKNNIHVKSNLSEGSIIMESTTGEFERFTMDVTPDKKGSDIELDIEVENGLISSIINSEIEARNKLKEANKQSLTEQYFVEAGLDNAVFAFDGKLTNKDLPGAKLPEHRKFDITLDDELEIPNIDNSASDGLINTKTDDYNKIKTINGCILKRLPREQITPILLNDVCLGYYYFEFNNGTAMFEERYSTGMVNTITGLKSNGHSEAFDAQARREEMLRAISNQLADKIDTKFINDNQDLKKEIYHILKYNDEFLGMHNALNRIKVSYIPPEDIHHIYFKLDKTTNRGISDLHMSLIPAKLWVAIYITNALGIMTRGNDKRVYYVKQSVESNISKTLLKTINEIKRANFGMRQIENINSVLNITGRFNDYIIPRGADGNSPIDFEVMQGQQIEIKTELLNLLEESAINVTGVPIELIQNRQSPDYAIQLTMSNSKFLRYVYTRQSQFQNQMNKLYTKIYNIEYGLNDKITLTLPPPLFINITNTNQLVTNTSDYCDAITNIVLADEQDDVLRAKFSKELKIYHLGSYLNMNVINDILNKARQSVAKDTASKSDTEEVY